MMVFVPPACGPVVLTSHSVSFAGVARFFPLVPLRFSAPEFPPEPGSGLTVFAVPYVNDTCSLDAVVPAAPRARRIQTSKLCVVALLKFLTVAQSTTSQLVVVAAPAGPSDRTAILMLLPAVALPGFRSF